MYISPNLQHVKMFPYGIYCCLRVSLLASSKHQVDVSSKMVIQVLHRASHCRPLVLVTAGCAVVGTVHEHPDDSAA